MKFNKTLGIVFILVGISVLFVPYLFDVYFGSIFLPESELISHSTGTIKWYPQDWKFRSQCGSSAGFFLNTELSVTNFESLANSSSITIPMVKTSSIDTDCVPNMHQGFRCPDPENQWYWNWDLRKCVNKNNGLLQVEPILYNTGCLSCSIPGGNWLADYGITANNGWSGHADIYVENILVKTITSFTASERTISESQLKEKLGRSDGLFEGKIKYYAETPANVTNQKSGSKEIEFKFFKESNLCTVLPGYVLASEDVPAGKTFNKFSLRAKVEAFCNSYPVWKLKEGSNDIVQQSTSELQLLRTGNQLTVPAGEVWRVYYISLSPPITKACDLDQLLDIQKNECVSKPGFLHYCAEGTFSEAELACLVQPVTRCVEGVFVEKENGTTECVKFVKPSYVCNNIAYETFEQAKEKCTDIVSKVYICNNVEYATLQEAQSKCTSEISQKYSCKGISYDNYYDAKSNCTETLPISYVCKGISYINLEEASQNCKDMLSLTYTCNGVSYNSLDDAQNACKNILTSTYVCLGIGYNSYNEAKSKCTNPVAVSYLCDGNFYYSLTNAQANCTKQASQKFSCNEIVYNTLQEAESACTKQLQVTELPCPEGSTLKILESGTKKCIYQPEPACEKGELSLNELGKEICKYFPETEPQKVTEVQFVSSVEKALSGITGQENKPKHSLISLGLASIFLITGTVLFIRRRK